ncbi:folate-binding protein YgfZ [Ehrlichia ruminantium]|uniref:Folate-binding protein YgfZ n=1 Tax=Ehrlichia ruminantium TaxID=779 RepID=A0AAE6QA81_EHRRU|nr:folate-binding protein YgfZ [Ehrlichia ruminantium]QGR02177.1 folate-binding protein YgfZ [Ehrlichia ruminantium]QGR03098.1 folate-binding protein YgfZ [Ehrlichia ruminantium]QGR04023.1 folate-binding protein YgfZ [Ehrlichia ruminantium]
MNQFIILPNRSIIMFHGLDAKQLLNRTTTNNVLNLANDRTIYSLLLTPNGRYLYDFFVVQSSKCILLDCHSADRDSLIQKFLLYKLQSKIIIKEKKQYRVGVYIGDQYNKYQAGYTYYENNAIFFQDPRLSKLGLRVIFHESNELFSYSAQNSSNYEKYEILRISNTVPDCNKDMIQGTSFPLQFRIQQLNGVDFNKGCYIGQEVVARMYRAGIKKSIYTIVSEHELIQGAKVVHSQQEIGTVLSCVGNMGLCLLNVSSESELSDLRVGDTQVKILSS